MGFELDVSCLDEFLLFFVFEVKSFKFDIKVGFCFFFVVEIVV